MSTSERAIASSRSLTLMSSPGTDRSDGRAHLVGVEHRLEHDRALTDAQGAELLLLPHRHLGDGDALRLLQRLSLEVRRA